MRVLVVNPPPSVESSINRIMSDDLEIFRIRRPGEAIAILEEADIDMALVFLKSMDKEAYSSLLSILGNYPDMKVIGLADTGTNDFITFLENVDLTPVEAGRVD